MPENDSPVAVFATQDGGDPQAERFHLGPVCHPRPPVFERVHDHHLPAIEASQDFERIYLTVLEA